MKRYEEKEVKRILRQELVLPQEVNEKVLEAYGMLSGKSYQTTKRHSCRKWVLVGAAAAMIAASTLGVMAANGFFTKEVTEQGENLTYDFHINYELTPGDVTVTPGYIPEGYQEFEEGKYDKDGQHKNGISICGVNAAWLARQPHILQTEELKDLEKTTLNHMEAHVLTLNWDTERSAHGFNKRIYLFNPEEGYVVIVYGGDDISKEELKKVADHLDIQVDQTHTQAYASQEEMKKEQAAQEEWVSSQAEARARGASPEQVKLPGEAFCWDGQENVQTTVESVKLVDSLTGYDQAYIADYGELSYWVKEDGSLKSYERLTFDNDTQKEVSREEVGQKLLEVKVKAENPTDEVIDYWAGAGQLCRMEQQGDGTYAYLDTWTEALDLEHGLFQIERYPVYFDQAQHTGEDRNAFFFRDLQPGETLEFTLLYLADEDMTDCMYLNYNASDEVSEDFFVDVSVKEK